MRRFYRWLALAFVFAVIASPFAILNGSLAGIGNGLDETLHTLSHLAGLLGISLLFIQIVTGGFRPLLRKVFHPGNLQTWHQWFGLAGLFLVVAHFAFLIPSLGEHWGMLNHGFFILGPVMLFVLLLAVGVILFARRRFPAFASRLHVANYAVFTVGMIHALAIGTQAKMLATRLTFAVFVAIALAGLSYRASTPAWRRKVVGAPALQSRRGG